MKLIDYSRAVNLDRKNEMLREEYYKACYELFDSVMGNSDELRKICKREGIGLCTIRKYAKIYFLDFLGMSLEDYNVKYIYPNRLNAKYKMLEHYPSVVNDLFFKIMVEDDFDVIIDLIQESNIDINALRERITSFVCIYFPNDKEYLIDSLREKINVYVNYKKTLNALTREQEMFKLLKEKELNEIELYQKNKFIIERFINCEYTKKQEYCKNYLIDISFFEQLLKLCKKYDEELMEKYIEKVNYEIKKRFSVMLMVVKDILYYIENGVMLDDGNIRSFDIIDYYLMTKLDSDSLLKMFDGYLNLDELKSLKIFFTRNKNNILDKPHEITKILDSNSKQFVGNREIEIFEKEAVIKFLRKNGIPLNNGTYTIVLRRYIKGTLILEENHRKKIR